jgi:hypothetical protein
VTRYLAGPLGLTVLVVLGITLSASSQSQSQQTDASVNAGSRDFPTWTGVGSCAASACHNANFDKGNRDEHYAKQAEYSVWLTRDPHQKAYAVLFSDIGRDIERNFNRLPLNAEIHAERDAVCLRCHVDSKVTKAPTSFADTPVWFQDGVGCESCHGGAKDWLDKHYSLECKNLNTQQKEATGFKYTKSLKVAVETCLPCHVGSRDCESGHDLLAAGHPRLNFDFSLAMAQYPKHWSDKEDHERYPDYAAQTWGIGSTIVSKAAFDQLAYHTSEGRPWPEFADHDCYACHHDLKGESWRQSKSHYQGRTPGSLPINSWYTTMAQLPIGSNPEIDAAIQKLSKAMDESPPNRLDTRKHAQELSRLLSEHADKIESMHFSEKSLKALYTAIALDKDNLHRTNWDAAAEIYLGLAALDQSSRDLNPAKRDQPRLGLLDQMDALLGLGRQRPPQVHFDSPNDFRPEEIGKVLRELQQGLGK